MKFIEFTSTMFYSGYFPVGPGTAGTLVAVGIYILEYIIFGEISWIINVVIVALLLYPSVKICDRAEKFFGIKDPPQVVIDESLGYWIAVLCYPFNLKIVAIAFFIFRLFDILKPYPIKKIQNLRGGLGIMVYDWLAGIYTNLMILLIIFISGQINMPIY